MKIQFIVNFHLSLRVQKIVSLSLSQSVQQLPEPHLLPPPPPPLMSGLQSEPSRCLRRPMRPGDSGSDSRDPAGDTETQGWTGDNLLVPDILLLLPSLAALSAIIERGERLIKLKWKILAPARTLPSIILTIIVISAWCLLTTTDTNNK